MIAQAELHFPVMTGDTAALWRLLTTHHYGRARAATRAGLRQFFGVKDDRPIRAMIHDLIVIHRKPICTDRQSGGYFVAETEDELNEEFGLLRTQALSILQRASVLRKFDFSRIQRELEFDAT